MTQEQEPKSALDRAVESGIVPVVVIDGVADAERLGRALLDGGLPVAEVTLRTPGALAAVRRLAEEPRLVVGAGTVLDEAQFDAAAEAGATYVVSPGHAPGLFRAAARTGIPLLPGAVTAAEVMRVRDEGYRVVKFFPAEASGGAAAVAAFAGPFPDVRFVPTGGVGVANLRDYLRLSNVAAVGGSWMVPAALLGEPDGSAVLTTIIAEAVTAAAGARAERPPV